MNKRLSTKSILILALMLVSGCASMAEGYRQEVCNKERAYEHGMNDASSRKPMNSGFTTNCDLTQRDAIAQSYKEGYNAGLANRNARRANTSAAASDENRRPLINVNLGGTQHMGGSANAPNPKAFFCETEVFMTPFKAFGPTELEAREAVSSQCSAKYHRIHCENIECRDND